MSDEERETDGRPLPTGTASLRPRSGRAESEAGWAAAMAAAQGGDATAYRKLLEEVLPAVRRQVRSRLFDDALAEDVVQNAMLNLHRARHTFRPERPFGPWLRAIVRNALTDALRERGRRSAREIIVDELEQLPQAVTQPDPDAGDAVLSPALQRAMEGLPAKQREAVELIHLHGLSVAAAAVRAGVTPGALKVRAHRGYRALRISLGRDSR